MSDTHIKGTVLVVEDFRDTVDILRRLLTINKYEVESAESLAEARDSLSDINPDVILLDINLPDGSGLDLLHEIRSMDDEVPVIMLTAYTELENAIRSLQEGVDDFIPKPFENDYLVHAINRAFEKRRLKQRLKQSEKFRTLGELAAGVAHDFNNVLGSIGAHIYLIKKKAEEHGLRIVENITAIELAVEDGAEMVQRLNAMGRQQEDNIQQVEFGKLINDTILMTKPIWYHEPRRKGKKIDIVTDIEPHIHVRVNPSDIREVFTNLIFNAIDAMPQGGELSVFLRKDNDVVKCVFADSGIGMTDDVLNKVFDPFFTTKGHGTGLGLAVSYAIIQRHDGELSCESVPGRGTKFIIELPAAQ
jgi:signal transduction histidine kinase